MLIFNDNGFTKDPLNERTQRLLAIATHIQAQSVPLSIPGDILAWGLAAHDQWVAALGKSTVEMGQADEAYQDMQDADKLTFDYYMRCKELMKDRYGYEDKVLKVCGIKGAFPKSRKDRLRVTQDLLDGNAALTTEGDPHVLPAAFTDQLTIYLAASNDAFAKLVLKEKPEALKAVDIQNDLFNADTKQLRVLYSWVLMTWSKFEPYLLQLGFAPAVPHPGSGQPDAPQDLSSDFLIPNLTLVWKTTENTTGYQNSMVGRGHQLG